MRNQLIIFSKNRACQLHLLLTSINRNASDFFDKITVIYKANDEYINGYEKLKSNTGFNVTFVSEKNFKNDLLLTIDDELEYTTFLVDDVVVYGNINGKKQSVLGKITNNVCCFSLRLGLNCTYSHPANLSYNITSHTKEDDMVFFNFKEQMNGDFKYPLSTDGHIYKTEMIKELLIDTEFNNPNTLEANIQRHIGIIKSDMVCFETSKVVSIPANLVNETFKNRHGLTHFFSEESLNKSFLNDEIIDFDKMLFNDINGPHKEIKYEFKKN